MWVSVIFRVPFWGAHRSACGQGGGSGATMSEKRRLAPRRPALCRGGILVYHEIWHELRANGKITSETTRFLRSSQWEGGGDIIHGHSRMGARTHLLLALFNLAIEHASLPRRSTASTPDRNPSIIFGPSLCFAGGDTRTNLKMFKFQVRSFFHSEVVPTPLVEFHFF